MHERSRPWLPTTQNERVFLFTLALLLMLNATVVLFMLVGELPVLADLQAKPTPALADQAPEAKPIEVVETIDQHAQPQPADTSPPVQIEVNEPLIVQAVAPADDTPSTTPAVSLAPPAAPQDPAEPFKQATPQQDDASVTFFGVGIE